MDELDSDLRPEFRDCLARALQLPSRERALLAECLTASIDSLDEDESENEQVWLREAEARYSDYKQGRTSSRPADAVLRDALNAIR